MPEIRRAVALAKRVVFGYTPTITKLWIAVTDKCNSRCRTCNIWAQKPIDNPLTPDEIYKTLSDPVFKDVDYIINSGGEPTVREDLIPFLRSEHLALPNAVIQLSTNGLQPEKVIKVVEYFHENFPSMKMEIGTSLDGIGADHDNERRVEGNYAKVTYLIDELIKLREKYGRDRLTIGFGTVVTDRTIDSIPALRHYADERGIGMLIQWYNQSGFYSNTNSKDNSEEVSRIREVVKEADYTILSDLWCNYLEGKPHSFNCMALQSFYVIKCNGDIVPCLSYWNNRIGNVRNNTPSNILKRRGGITCTNHCLNSWATYWSFEADPIQYVKYFIRHPIKLVKKLCA